MLGQEIFGKPHTLCKPPVKKLQLTGKVSLLFDLQDKPSVTVKYTIHFCQSYLEWMCF